MYRNVSEYQRKRFYDNLDNDEVTHLALEVDHDPNLPANHIRNRRIDLSLVPFVQQDMITTESPTHLFVTVVQYIFRRIVTSPFPFGSHTDEDKCHPVSQWVIPECEDLSMTLLVGFPQLGKSMATTAFTWIVMFVLGNVGMICVKNSGGLGSIEGFLDTIKDFNNTVKKWLSEDDLIRKKLDRQTSLKVDDFLLQPFVKSSGKSDCHKQFLEPDERNRIHNQVLLFCGNATNFTFIQKNDMKNKVIQVTKSKSKSKPKSKSNDLTFFGNSTSFVLVCHLLTYSSEQRLQSWRICLAIDEIHTQIYESDKTKTDKLLWDAKDGLLRLIANDGGHIVGATASSIAVSLALRYRGDFKTVKVEVRALALHVSRYYSSQRTSSYLNYCLQVLRLSPTEFDVYISDDGDRVQTGNGKYISHAKGSSVDVQKPRSGMVCPNSNSVIVDFRCQRSKTKTDCCVSSLQRIQKTCTQSSSQPIMWTTM